MNAGFVVDGGAPELAWGGVRGVVADGDALEACVADDEEVAVACDVVVDAVQARVRRVDFPGEAHAVDVVGG